ncbi:hypothetical protein HDU96_006262 [Phlyctochytrium bullatum]|nr:hypothetical protein HDU96_006262 [Phlyctochytrium bullatum]
MQSQETPSPPTQSAAAAAGTTPRSGEGPQRQRQPRSKSVAHPSPHFSRQILKQVAMGESLDYDGMETARAIEEEPPSMDQVLDGLATVRALLDSNHPFTAIDLLSHLMDAIATQCEPLGLTPADDNNSKPKGPNQAAIEREMEEARREFWRELNSSWLRAISMGLRAAQDGEAMAVDDGPAADPTITTPMPAAKGTANPDVVAATIAGAFAAAAAGSDGLDMLHRQPFTAVNQGSSTAGSTTSNSPMIVDYNTLNSLLKVGSTNTEETDGKEKPAEKVADPQQEQHRQDQQKQEQQQQHESFLMMMNLMLDPTHLPTMPTDPSTGSTLTVPSSLGTPVSVPANVTTIQSHLDAAMDVISNATTFSSPSNTSDPLAAASAAAPGSATASPAAVAGIPAFAAAASGAPELMAILPSLGSPAASNGALDSADTRVQGASGGHDLAFVQGPGGMAGIPGGGMVNTAAAAVAVAAAAAAMGGLPSPITKPGGMTLRPVASPRASPHRAAASSSPTTSSSAVRREQASGQSVSVDWRSLRDSILAWSDVMEWYGLVDFENGFWETDILEAMMPALEAGDKYEVGAEGPAAGPEFEQGGFRLNRLKSIDQDAQFVSRIADLLPRFPVLANERCGVWYVDPERAHPQTVYFKSTDGHYGKWDFNMRRMNRHVLETIADSGGCIIVDSTRHGKRIPDSMAKTIPIWCCTINNAVWRHRHGGAGPDTGRQGEDGLDAGELEWDREVHTLPSVVSRNEHEEISKAISGFVEKLMRSPSIDLAAISNTLKKPLRPLWITRASEVDEDWAAHLASLDFYPVVCLSASEAVPDGLERRNGYAYIQGSADDHEAWGMGLTPSLFWKNRDRLVSSDSVVECEEIVREIVAELGPQASIRGKDQGMDPESGSNDTFTWIGGTGIAIGNRESEHAGMNPSVDGAVTATVPAGKRYLYLPIPEGKKGQAAMFENISTGVAFIAEELRRGGKILVHCMQGKDRSVSMVLSFLIQYADQHGAIHLDKPKPRGDVTKSIIQDLLLFIQGYRYVDQHALIDSRFREEVLKLEKKFLEEHKPLYQKRAAIIGGAVEPTDDESKPKELPEGEESEIGPAGPPPADGSGVKGIPTFWLTALKNHPIIGQQITDRDEDCLKSLSNITFAYLDDNPGFKLEFFFDDNEYFTNKVLTKTYFLTNSTDSSYGDIIYERAEGCEIDWKEGKNLSVTIEIKKQRHKASNKTRTVKKTVPAPTFFSFFKPPAPTEDEDEEVAAETEEILEADYEIGELIKEKIIPHAVDWFTGRALEYEDGFMGGEGDWEGDEEDDLGDEDDDDDGPGVAGPDGQEKPPECKQQ